MGYISHLQPLTLDDEAFFYAKKVREGCEIVDDELPFDVDEPISAHGASLVASERVGEMLLDPCFAAFLNFANEATDRFAAGDWGDLDQADQQRKEDSDGFKMSDTLSVLYQYKTVFCLLLNTSCTYSRSTVLSRTTFFLFTPTPSSCFFECSQTSIFACVKSPDEINTPKIRKLLANLNRTARFSSQNGYSLLC